MDRLPPTSHGATGSSKPATAASSTAFPAVLYIDGVDEGDTMVDVGPGIVDLLGMTREEWLATSEGWRDVMHPDDLDRIVEASERTVATGEPFREQYRAIHRDGHEVWIREEAIRVDDETATRSSGSV